MRRNATAAKAIATSIAIVVILRVFVVMMTSFSRPDFTVGFGIAPNQRTLADFTAGRELHPALKGLYLVASTSYRERKAMSRARGKV